MKQHAVFKKKYYIPLHNKYLVIIVYDVLVSKKNVFNLTLCFYDITVDRFNGTDNIESYR